MSNLASIVNGTGLREAGPLAMGPARVIEAGARRVRLRREDGAEVDAELALASPYEPAVDDVVLCVGDEVRHYVIGVLVGSGRTQLSFQGDVDLQARGGRVRIAADEGVELASRRVAIQAGELSLRAQSMVQKVDTLVQRVRGLWRSRAGRAQNVVDEGLVSKAKSATYLTEEAMTLNGKQINLG